MSASSLRVIWSSMDKLVGHIDWVKALAFLHLTMSVFILLVMILPWWISIPILGPYFVWFFGGTLPFGIGIKIDLWKDQLCGYWLNQKDQRVMAGVLLRRMLYDSRLSRLFRFRKQAPCLPPEIWEQILDYVIHVPVLFDTRCEVETFHRFIEAHRHEPYWPLYKASEHQRKKLRLVCKMWTELMDRQYPRWIIYGTPLDYKRGTSQIKRLDIGNSSRKKANTMIQGEYQQGLHLILSEPKKLSSVTTVCLNLSWPSVDSEEAASFLPRLRDLPRLRSLTYIDCLNEQPNQLLQELKHPYFASLTSLYISMEALHGPLRLESLEVLYLDVESYEVGQWSFPSLRHLAINCGCEGFIRSLPSSLKPLGEDSSPLAGPHSHLQSLFLLEEGVDVTLDDLFWQTYPHLRNMGVSCYDLTLASDVPLDHPLCCLIGTDSLDFDCLMLLSSRVPNIRQIYTRSHYHKVLESNTTLFSIFQDYQRRGIQLVGDGGVLDFQRKAILKRQVSSVELAFWFLCSLYSYIDVLFHYFQTRWWEPFSPLHDGQALYIIILFGLYISGIWVYKSYLSPKYEWVAKGVSRKA
ncbi:hypothetical protein CPB86DRAFT_782599 [Serendipita vermifera]|nr:hypothetical protein CPB86DRAFT_782599 [Serendipita vermifera]